MFFPERVLTWSFVLCLALALLIVTGCEKDGGTRTDGNNVIPDGLDTNSEPAPPGCGDGKLTKDEACDDGNTESGDGCAANCLLVAEGYSCNPPGKPCHPIAKCGDGSVLLPELCDDGNLSNGDGCSDLCKVEIGYKCDGQPSVCVPTVCGDGIQEGAEGCDDGNTTPFDGCDSRCQKEPDCSAGACSSSCGDGLVLGEECDDGNQLDGDGCSSDCRIENGYECPQEGCTDAATCTLRVAAVYRDFTGSHSDFGGNCDGLQTGMVQSSLGSDWKPVGTGVGCNVTGFADWYHTPVSKVGEIVLYPDGAGNFVNRFGPNGEKFQGVADQPPCTSGNCMKCQYSDQQCDIIEYDGNPLFFPVDDLGTDLYPAKVPEQYGWNGWPLESTVFPGAPMHNFYFTTEVTYWFRYDASTSATLNFTGDDDVWVFVNGQLVVDLGGAHVPLNGSVTINAANSYGMSDGQVYRINIFHAERKRDGSSFKLTLGGFNTARSECRPECGDGIVGLGEECDDGVNDGGYGECGPDCKLGEYCGDGIVQEQESCDDGNFVEDDGCPSSCRVIDLI